MIENMSLWHDFLIKKVINMCDRKTPTDKLMGLLPEEGDLRNAGRNACVLSCDWHNVVPNGKSSATAVSALILTILLCIMSRKN